MKKLLSSKTFHGLLCFAAEEGKLHVMQLALGLLEEPVPLQIFSLHLLRLRQSPPPRPSAPSLRRSRVVVRFVRPRPRRMRLDATHPRRVIQRGGAV